MKQSVYDESNPRDAEIQFMSMDQIKPKLCGKSRGDVYVCIDCASQCVYGKRALEIVENETRKKMNKKEICDASRQLAAMSNYLEAMQAENPPRFVMNKYNCKTERQAKNKIYQWQHNYGLNLRLIGDKISKIKEEITFSQKVNNVSSNILNKKIEEKTPENYQESEERSRKKTKKTEEKISKNYLAQTRTDLENEFLQAEKEIEEHKKAITACENRMQYITEKIQAIRQVLDMFKEKEGDNQ